jgi:hypothetical protein
VVLLGDRIGGHWRRTVGRREVHVQVHLLEHPDSREAKAIDAATRELGRFLRMPVVLALDRRRPPAA